MLETDPPDAVVPSSSTPAGEAVPAAPSHEVLTRRLRVLLVTRVVVATLLFGGTLLLALRGGRSFSAFTPAGLIGATVATFAASGAFAVWLGRGRRLQGLVTAQIVFDLGLATFLVYLSGAAGSLLSVLYGIVVLYAAMTRGPAASRAVAAISIVLHAGVGYGVATGALPPPPDQPSRPYALEAAELAFALLSNTVALLVVAALASNLSQRVRRASGRLRVVQRQADRLARLNDDIVRSMSSGLLTTDLEGVVLRANPSAAEILASEPESLVGTSIDQWITFGDEEGRGEADARRADGGVVRIGYTKTPLRSVGGEVEGALLVFVDLTEIHALREEADRAQRLALLGGVAAGLAHEIRNPLGAISGSVQMVTESPSLEPDDRQLLSIVLDEVDRLNALVTTMLEIGRSPPLRPGRTDLVTMAREVASVAAQDETLRAADIEVVVEEDSHPAHVDPDRVRQLLWNLLKNAVQASPEGGRVEIRIANETHGDEGVRIEVADAGPGVPESDRARLFDTFFSKRTHGIGLGLALVKQIVDGHGGAIEVGESDLGGAAFRVWLPAQPPRLSGRVTPVGGIPVTPP